LFGQDLAYDVGAGVVAQTAENLGPDALSGEVNRDVGRAAAHLDGHVVDGHQCSFGWKLRQWAADRVGHEYSGASDFLFFVHGD
jgi:hypothetical protein